MDSCKPMHANNLPGRTQFARRLKKLRERRALSQYELAKISGVSRALIARLETGHSHPLAGRLDSFVRLSRALHTTVDQLVRGIRLERATTTTTTDENAPD